MRGNRELGAQPLPDAFAAGAILHLSEFSCVPIAVRAFYATIV